MPRDAKTVAPPADWSLQPLGRVAEVAFSNVDKKSRPREPRVRLCNYLDVYQNQYVDDTVPFMEATATPQEIQRFGVRAGDVLITKDSETPDDIGIPTVVKDVGPDVVCGYHLALMRPRSGINSDFLSKQLRTERIRRYFSKEANGTTRYGLSTASVTAIPLWLPKESEQRRIAEILDTLDEAIRKTEQVIAKLQQIKQGLLHDLLTRGIDGKGELRDPDRYPEQFKDSPLGRIPREWVIATIAESCNAVVDCPHSTPSFCGEGILVARTMHIRHGRYDIQASSRVSEDEYRVRIARLEPLAGDVIFAREAPVGEAFTIPEGMRICLGQRVMLLRPSKFRLLGDYLVAQIYSGAVKRRIGQLTGGTTNPHLNVQEVKDFRIPLPAVDEQFRMVSRLDGLESRLLREQGEVAKLSMLKFGLMDDLLTGRVRVSVPEDVAA
jgi:type I restriction enzyme, S subunit